VQNNKKSGKKKYKIKDKNIIKNSRRIRIAKISLTKADMAGNIVSRKEMVDGKGDQERLTKIYRRQKNKLNGRQGKRLIGCSRKKQRKRCGKQ